MHYLFFKFFFFFFDDRFFNDFKFLISQKRTVIFKNLNFSLQIRTPWVNLVYFMKLGQKLRSPGKKWHFFIHPVFICLFISLYLSLTLFLALIFNWLITCAQGFVGWFFKATVEPVFPELTEPGVSTVVIRIQVEVIIIETFNIIRMDLYRDATHCLLLEILHYIPSIRPSITENYKLLSVLTVITKYNKTEPSKNYPMWF